jgi:hypothetical protein
MSHESQIIERGTGIKKIEMLKHIKYFKYDFFEADATRSVAKISSSQKPNG